MMMLLFQDWTIFIAHTTLVLFNMFGWIWPATRCWHRITVGLTACSWFVLGALYGWGYCLCTDYHAHVLRQLGNPDANLTFIQLMLKRLLGLSVERGTADTLAIVVFAAIVIAMLVTWRWSTAVAPPKSWAGKPSSDSPRR